MDILDLAVTSQISEGRISEHFSEVCDKIFENLQLVRGQCNPAFSYLLLSISLDARLNAYVPQNNVVGCVQLVKICF